LLSYYSYKLKANKIKNYVPITMYEVELYECVTTKSGYSYWMSKSDSGRRGSTKHIGVWLSRGVFRVVKQGGGLNPYENYKQNSHF